MNNTTFPKSFRLRVGRHKGLIATVKNSVVLPEYNACFWNLLIAVLDPIDRVQPRSRNNVRRMVGKDRRD